MTTILLCVIVAAAFFALGVAYERLIRSRTLRVQTRQTLPEYTHDVIRRIEENLGLPSSGIEPVYPCCHAAEILLDGSAEEMLSNPKWCHHHWYDQDPRVDHVCHLAAGHPGAHECIHSVALRDGSDIYPTSVLKAVVRRLE